MDQRQTDRIGCELLVVGGGAAGVSVAVTAARAGLDVVLVERYGFCGGGAVAGLSGTLCGLYEASDNSARPPVQVVFGFAEEFRRVLETLGGLGPALRYGKTFTHVHDPLVWRETADALLAGAGVRVVYHATATGLLMEDGDRVAGACFWTKQGPLEVRAGLVVDASGDADLVAMAGLPCHVGQDGHVQNPTMIFRLCGVDITRFQAAYGTDTIMPAPVGAMIVAARDAGHDLPRTKIWLFPTTRDGELLCNCTRVIGADGRELNALHWRDFSEAEIEGRRQVRAYARFFREYLAGCEQSWLNDTAPQVGIRQTRQLTGMHVLTNAEVLAGAKSVDGIARSPWPIELHSGERPHVHWLIEDSYEVPFGCFVPRTGEGLLVAGRCLSAEHEAVASARVTAQCFAYGQAVAWAAWLVLRERISTRAVQGRDVRTLLNRDGAQLN